jgi:RNA-directed DNA polymerase
MTYSFPEIVIEDEIVFAPPNFSNFFSLDQLRQAFLLDIQPRGGRGIDRIGVDVFKRQLLMQTQNIARRINGGAYRFTPFIERLVARGRDKFPRVLSIPTIRDRLVLHQLKDYLHLQLPDCVGRLLPNEYVRSVKRFVRGHGGAPLSYIRMDVKDFYPRIDHDLLLRKLRERQIDNSAIALIWRALRTPTVLEASSQNQNRLARNRRGIPQGLAISNVLANLYLQETDTEQSRECMLYLRFVDDILILLESSRAAEAQSGFESRLANLGLELNTSKTITGPITDEFTYIGYAFRLPVISVKQSNCERFLRLIAATFSEFRYRMSGPRPAWQTLDRMRDAFVEELNERITGAIDGARRYGWIFFYLEITDVRLLHQFDGVIRRMFSRLPQFAGPPRGLKSLVRAHFQAIHSPQQGYIQNYNQYETVEGKLDYLIRRAVVDPADRDRMSVGEVQARFAKHRKERLDRLDKDISRFY